MVSDTGDQTASVQVTGTDNYCVSAVAEIIGTGVKVTIPKVVEPCAETVPAGRVPCLSSRNVPMTWKRRKGTSGRYRRKPLPLRRHPIPVRVCSDDGPINIVLINNHRDPDLRRRDHLDVHPDVGKR